MRDRIQELQARALRAVKAGRPTMIEISEMADASGRWAAYVCYSDEITNDEVTVRITEPAQPDAPQWAREKFPDWNTDDLEGRV